MRRWMPLWITLLASIPTVIMWALFLGNQLRIVEKREVSLAGSLLLDQEVTRQAVLDHLPRCLSPLRLLRISLDGVFLLVAATVLAIVLWQILSKPGTPWSSSPSRMSLAALPLLAGLFRFPTLVAEMAKAMARAGLSSAGLFGSGLAEALVFPIWGLGLSLGLALTFWLCSARSAASSAA